MGTNSFDSEKFKDGQRQHWDSVAAGWKKWWETIEQFAQIVTNSLTELAEKHKGVTQYPNTFSKGQDFPVGVVK